MIPFDFQYYRPDTVEEATKLFAALVAEGKQPMYYSGGTEIICLARLNQLHMDAVVDIKAIPECQRLELQADRLVIGGGITLGQIEEANYFPLMTKTGGRVADHTSRGRITLGGNICGVFVYREAVLPLLLTNADITLAGPAGIRTVPICSVFDKSLLRAADELVVQVQVGREYLQLPYFHVKMTRLDKIDYPLVTIAGLKKDGHVRMAFSGLCDFPFRSLAMEKHLNDWALPIEYRVRNAMAYIPGPVTHSIEGSSEYRRFLLQGALMEAMSQFAEVA